MTFSVMAKPSGPDCNLRCTYCFYLDDQARDPHAAQRRMDDETLEAYIRETINAHPPGASVPFTWQGGEPTLLGLDFFRVAVELQRMDAKPGQCIQNSLQTNGLMIDAEWCEFLADNHFLVGVSIDGGEVHHDHYRKDAGGADTWWKASRAYQQLRVAGVECNVLCTVNRWNAADPRTVYMELTNLMRPAHIQFIPVVERDPDTLAPTPESVTPEAWGNFLCAVWDEWVACDVGEVFVNIFDERICTAYGMPAQMCIHAPTCGTQLAMEHTGDVYSCDHFVSEQYKLGNVKTSSFASMLASEKQRKFGNDKLDTLPDKCRACEFLLSCGGDCMAHRHGEGGVSWLCEGHLMFYRHSAPQVIEIVNLVRDGKEAREIMGQYE